MKIQIFDPEHVSCALVTADTGAHILIDAGHNTTTNWRPSTYLSGLGVTLLEQLIITNYDAYEREQLGGNVNVGLSSGRVYRSCRR